MTNKPTGPYTDCTRQMRRDVRTFTCACRGVPLRYDEPCSWCENAACVGNELNEADLPATQERLRARRAEAERFERLVR